MVALDCRGFMLKNRTVSDSMSLLGMLLNLARPQLWTTNFPAARGQTSTSWIQWGLHVTNIRHESSETWWNLDINCNHLDSFGITWFPRAFSASKVAAAVLGLLCVHCLLLSGTLQSRENLTNLGWTWKNVSRCFMMFLECWNPNIHQNCPLLQF